MADYTDIQIPVGGQPASAALFGTKVRDYILDLNNRVTPLETSNQRIVKRGRRTTPTGNIINVETGVLRVDDIPVVAGGIYRISTSNVNLDATVANDIGDMKCRVATGVLGTQATTSSTQIGRLRTTIDDIGFSNVLALQTFFVASVDTYLSVLLTCVRIQGTGNVVVFCSGTEILDLTIEFAGADPGNTGVII